jgi:hypothetical protein
MEACCWYICRCAFNYAGSYSFPAEDAYYAGLFCDVGKLAFDVLIQKGILPLYKFTAASASGKSFHEIEESLLGFDHTTIAQLWLKGGNCRTT